MHRTEIPIASPCGMDWNAMTPADGAARFCDTCRKHVHDLSKMTQADAKALLASRQTEDLCIRYLYDERGQVWFMPNTPPIIAPGRLARAKRFVAMAAAVAAPLSLTACMGAAMPPPPRPPVADWAAPTPEPSAAPTPAASVAAPDTSTQIAAPVSPEAPAKPVSDSSRAPAGLAADPH